MLGQALHETVPVQVAHFGQHSRTGDFVRDRRIAGETADALIGTGAYRVVIREPESQWPLWKMGIRAPAYCNCRDLLTNTATRVAVSGALAQSIKLRFPETTAIAGVASAGIPWATSVADQLSLPLVYVLARPKTHGIGGHIQGNLPAGSMVVIIDDLVASGSSVAHARSEIEGIGSRVLGMHSIVNWGFDGMRKHMADMPFFALTTYSYIVLQAVEQGLIEAAEMERLLDFYVKVGASTGGVTQ